MTALDAAACVFGARANRERNRPSSAIRMLSSNAAAPDVLSVDRVDLNVIRT